MSDQNSPPSPQRRRSSFVDLFTTRPTLANAGNPPANAISSSPPSSAVPASPNPPQHRRGTSITALGLTTSTQGQASPYGAFARQRRASVATSSTSGSPEFRNSFGDEPAVLEDDEGGKSGMNNPASPLGRRLSFGAQALREVKGSNSPGSPGAGEGFNWSDALRDRTKRSPSFSSGNPFAANAVRPRATSTTGPEPPKEILKPVEVVTRMKKPDHLGERMLRGEFMMD